MKKDRRFILLKDHITSMRTLEMSNLAKMAMESPEDLVNNSEYRITVACFRMLDALLDKVDELEG